MIRLLIARIAMVLRHAPQSVSLCWLRGGLYGGWLAGVGCLLATASVLGAEAQPAAPPNLLLDAQLRHVRREGEREWADFPEQPESNQFSVRFEVPEGTTWRTLRLRQVDVRQSWSVRLNDRELGSLVADENDQIRLLSIPPGTLRPEENELTIAQGTGSTAVDDIRVGAAELLELDAEEFAPESVSLSADGLSAFVKLSEMRENFVYDFNFAALRSSDGSAPLNQKAAYTVRRKP